MQPQTTFLDLRCARCGVQLAPTLRACPNCGALVHSDRLNTLANEAAAATARGDTAAALSHWREALDLLPVGSRQREVVTEKVNALSARVHSGAPAGKAPAESHKGAKGALVGAGALALLLWKFKFVLGFILTKGKLLLLGLTKFSTLFSMILSLGAYWSLWGWKFALGFVLSIYVHEMGHVFALKRYGIKASAPMFIPGVGAVVRLGQMPANPRENAAVGLAGPIYGLAAAVAACVLWLATGHLIFAAIAKAGAWINLLNLVPLGPLDGGRAYDPMSRNQRWLCVAAMMGSWFWTEDNMLFVIALVGIMRALGGRDEQQGDTKATMQYITLVAALSALYGIPVDIG